MVKIIIQVYHSLKVMTRGACW